MSSREAGLEPERIDRLADDIALLRSAGREVLIVSSGAIVSGINKLALKEYPKSLPVKQAAAAVGQSRLMWAYEKSFERLGLKVAQILLTHHDLADRRRFLNARHTLTALIEFQVIPIINENDPFEMKGIPCLPCNIEMAVVNRIESPPQEPDAHRFRSLYTGC